MSNVEQTLSIIKPDAVERNLENEISCLISYLSPIFTASLVIFRSEVAIFFV